MGDLAAVARLGPAGVASVTLLLALAHAAGGLRLLVLGGSLERRYRRGMRFARTCSDS